MAAAAAYRLHICDLEAVLEDQVEAVLELVLEGPGGRPRGREKGPASSRPGPVRGVRLLVLEAHHHQGGDQGDQDEPA